MTSATAHPPIRPARRTSRTDTLLAALLLCAVAGLAALGIASAGASAPRTAAAAAHVALVVDAGGRPHAALERARAAAERSGGVDVAVRVPRTAPEAAADVRYFAAQRYEAVVAVGPLARAAAGAATRDYPHTRFSARGAVPRTLP
jgi:basic membrane lipoprotein Med (substrate-binding protein (PBP1-ABC) superfamily)